MEFLCVGKAIYIFTILCPGNRLIHFLQNVIFSSKLLWLFLKISFDHFPLSREFIFNQIDFPRSSSVDVLMVVIVKVFVF